MADQHDNNRGSDISSQARLGVAGMIIGFVITCITLVLAMIATGKAW